MQKPRHSKQALFNESICRYLARLDQGLPVNVILSLMRDELESTVGFRRVWLYRLADDRSHFEMVVEVMPGLNRSVAGHYLKIEGDRHHEELLLARDLVVVEDARTDARLNLELVRLLENRTILHMPVEIRGQFFWIGTGTFGREGVVRLESAGNEYFKALARLAAFAISNVPDSVLSLRIDEIRSKFMPDLLQFPGLTFWERDFKTGKLLFTATQSGQCKFDHENDMDSFEKYLGQIHPDDVDGIKNTAENYLQERRDYFQVEYRLRDKNNSYGWYQTEGTILYDNLNQPVKLTGICFAITDRKNAEQKVAAYETRLKLLLNEGNISLWDLDIASGRLHFHDGFILGLDYSVAETPRIIQEAIALIHPEDATALSEAIGRASSGDCHTIDITSRIRHADGSYRWIRTRCFPEFDSLGEPVRVLGCCVDVTSQKMAESSLQLHQAQLLAMVRESSVRMALLDRNFNYIAVSSAWMAKWNPDNREMIGTNHLDWFPELTEHHKNIYQAAMMGAFLTRENESLIRADGNKHFFHVSVGPWYNADGKIGGIFIAGEDVTRQRELEQEVLEIAGKSHQRMSEDLHDTVCQELTSLRVYCDALCEMTRPLDDDLHKLTLRLDEGLRQCNLDIRRLMSGQMPVMVSGDGFLGALEDLTQQADGWSSSKVVLIVESKPGQLDNFTASQLFMIAREAVHNALKHARPTIVRIRLRAVPHLLLAVENDVDQRNSNHKMDGKAGLGRKIMENRASLIGGVIKFRQTSNKRSILSCEISRIRPRN